MKALGMILGLWAVCSMSWAEGAASGATATAKISAMEIKADEIIVTSKEGYIHILWDTFPAQGRVKDFKKKLDLKAAVLDLLQGPGKDAAAKVQKARVDIVEFSEKDSYGEPRWDKVKFLGRFEAERKKDQWKIKIRK